MVCEEFVRGFHDNMLMGGKSLWEAKQNDRFFQELNDNSRPSQTMRPPVISSRHFFGVLNHGFLKKLFLQKFFRKISDLTILFEF